MKTDIAIYCRVSVLYINYFSRFCFQRGYDLDSMGVCAFLGVIKNYSS